MVKAKKAFQEYLTIQEVAELTRRSVVYLYKLKHEEKIPYIQQCRGGKLLFVKAEIIAWMNGEYKLHAVSDDEKVEKEVLAYMQNKRKKGNKS